MPSRVKKKKKKNQAKTKELVTFEESFLFLPIRGGSKQSAVAHILSLGAHFMAFQAIKLGYVDLWPLAFGSHSVGQRQYGR